MSDTTSKSERMNEEEAKLEAIDNLHEWGYKTGKIMVVGTTCYELESIVEAAVDLGMKVVNEPGKAAASEVRLKRLVSLRKQIEQRIEDSKKDMLENKIPSERLVESMRLQTLNEVIDLLDKCAN